MDTKWIFLYEWVLIVQFKLYINNIRRFICQKTGWEMTLWRLTIIQWRCARYFNYVEISYEWHGLVSWMKSMDQISNSWKHAASKNQVVWADVDVFASIQNACTNGHMFSDGHLIIIRIQLNLWVVILPSSLKMTTHCDLTVKTNSLQLFRTILLFYKLSITQWFLRAFIATRKLVLGTFRLSWITALGFSSPLLINDFQPVVHGAWLKFYTSECIILSVLICWRSRQSSIKCETKLTRDEKTKF